MTTPNLLTIITQAGPVECTAAELLDLDASFSRHPSDALIPLPDCGGTYPEHLGCFVDPAEMGNGFLNTHSHIIKHCFTSMQIIDAKEPLSEYEAMLNDDKTQWLIDRLHAAIQKTGLSKRAFGIRCGCKTETAGQTVNGWLKTGRISKEMLAQVALVADEPIESFIYGAQLPEKVAGIAQEARSELDRLISLGLLSDIALQGILAHIKSYAPAQAEQSEPQSEQKTSDKLMIEADQPAPGAAPRPASTGESESAEDFLKAQMLIKEPIKKQV